MRLDGTSKKIPKPHIHLVSCAVTEIHRHFCSSHVLSFSVIDSETVSPIPGLPAAIEMLVHSKLDFILIAHSRASFVWALHVCVSQFSAPVLLVPWFSRRNGTGVREDGPPCTAWARNALAPGAAAGGSAWLRVEAQRGEDRSESCRHLAAGR